MEKLPVATEKHIIGLPVCHAEKTSIQGANGDRHPWYYLQCKGQTCKDQRGQAPPALFSLSSSASPARFAITLDKDNLMSCHSYPKRKSQGKNHRKTKIPFPFPARDLQSLKTALHYHRRGWGHSSLYGRACVWIDKRGQTSKASPQPILSA